MTSKEAREEAERRWPTTARRAPMAERYESRGREVYRVGFRLYGQRMTSGNKPTVMGRGRSWEEAFQAADAKAVKS